MRLNGKVAVITAASKGLGRGIAYRFAQEGAKLVIASRDHEQITAAADDIRRTTCAEVTELVADVTNKQDIDQLVDTVGKRFGKVDILINNAGGPPAGKFLQFSDEDWYRAVDLLLMSVVRVTRGLLPYMMENKRGRIITITSMGVKQPLTDLVLSNSIRAAVTGLTKSLAQELAPYQITVNNLAPGRIDTDRVRQLDEFRARDEGTSTELIKANWFNQIPLGRYGTVEEFANVALFLASEESSYITGQTYLVDGGLVRAY